jgi:hypothetical protein
MQQNAGLFTPEDGHNNARNMLRKQTSILLHLVGYLFYIL